MTLEKLRQVSEQLQAIPEVKQVVLTTLVIAYSHDNFRTWARQFGIDRSCLTYISDASVVEGYRDYTLIVLPGARLDNRMLNHLYTNARVIYDTKLSYPVVQTGRIVRWENFKKP